MVLLVYNKKQKCEVDSMLTVMDCVSDFYGHELTSVAVCLDEKIFYSLKIVECEFRSILGCSVLSLWPSPLLGCQLVN